RERQPCTTIGWSGTFSSSWWAALTDGSSCRAQWKVYLWVMHGRARQRVLRDEQKRLAATSPIRCHTVQAKSGKRFSARTFQQVKRIGWLQNRKSLRWNASDNTKAVCTPQRRFLFGFDAYECCALRSLFCR